MNLHAVGTTRTRLLELLLWSQGSSWCSRLTESMFSIESGHRIHRIFRSSLFFAVVFVGTGRAIPVALSEHRYTRLYTKSVLLQRICVVTSTIYYVCVCEYVFLKLTVSHILETIRNPQTRTCQNCMHVGGPSKTQCHVKIDWPIATLRCTAATGSLTISVITSFHRFSSNSNNNTDFYTERWPIEIVPSFWGFGWTWIPGMQRFSVLVFDFLGSMTEPEFGTNQTTI